MMLPRFLRPLALAAGLLLLLAGAGPAQSQPAASPPAPAPVSTDELQKLVGTLKDEKARGALIDELQSLIAAQRGREQKQEEENPATLLDNFARQIDAISEEILAAASVVVQAPRLVAWIQEQADDREARILWLDIGLKLGITFGVALIGEWLVRLLLRHPGARLASRSSDAVTARILLLLLQLFIEALPIVVFAGIAYFVLPLVQPRFATAHVAAVIIHATLLARLLLALVHVALLTPSAATFYTLDEETRNYLYIWARRFTNWAIYGYALVAAAWWLGVPGAIYGLLLRGAAVVLMILSVIFVLQNRVAVANMLRGRSQANGSPDGRQGWRQLRHRLAEIWHVPAIIYIIGTFGSFVLRIEGGSAFVFRATLLSFVVLVVAGLIVRGVRRLSQRGFAIGLDLKNRFPTLETRANRYLPVLTVAISLIVYCFAALALLQAWGVDAYAWFNTTFGRRVAGSLVSSATVLVAALILWELFGSAIERYLNGTSADGRRVARSARVRTLLPLLRTAVFIMLFTVVTLIVLSEIGVNIAPLLAGAGVVGLAIGFGSQALVKDVITGFFILLEDTLAVGEMVDVGKDHIGIVEAISIRTIKLRDQSGTVHTVPFSEVSTVRNMTRDYSYFVSDVGVLYSEDVDRVVAVLRDVADDLAKDPAWASFILEPLDVIGVDKFTESAVVIRIRLKTIPLKQGPVGREYNRRMKKAFDIHRIEMPSANQTHYLATDDRAAAQ